MVVLERIRPLAAVRCRTVSHPSSIVPIRCGEIAVLLGIARADGYDAHR
jgi:hypothetical protein